VDIYSIAEYKKVLCFEVDVALNQLGNGNVYRLSNGGERPTVASHGRECAFVIAADSSLSITRAYIMTAMT